MKTSLKKTTVKITEATLLLENAILSHMDIPRTVFHRRAIDHFINSGLDVHPYLLIKERTHPKYIKKDATEQVYLDDERRAALDKIAEKNVCGYTIVLCYALMNYCGVMAPIILGEDVMNRLMNVK